MINRRDDDLLILNDDNADAPADELISTKIDEPVNLPGTIKLPIKAQPDPPSDGDYEFVSRFQIGVTRHFVSWFQEFMKQKDQDLAPTLTTEQLVLGRYNLGSSGPSPMEWCLKDQCAIDKCSFIEWCIKNGHTHTKEGFPLFGKVNAFVSHAWACRLVDLFDAISQHSDEVTSQHLNIHSHRPPPHEYGFFLDIFVVNQHLFPWNESPPLNFNIVLRSTIASCMKTIVVLSPFEDPIPLQRCWCIFELHTTRQLQASLHVHMPLIELERFHDILIRGTFDFNDWISRINIADADAVSTADKDMIMQLVAASPGGAAALNRSVVILLSDWLISQGNAAMKQLTPNERIETNLVENLAGILWRQHKVAEAGALFSEMVEDRIRHFGKGHERTLAGQHLYAWFLRTRSELTRADEIFMEVVQGRQSVLGEKHPDTLSSRMEQAEVWKLLGRLDECESSMNSVIGLWRELISTTPDNKANVGAAGRSPRNQLLLLMYRSMQVYVSVLLALNKTDVVAMVSEIIHGRVKLLGKNHPYTIDAIIMKVVCLSKREELKQIDDAFLDQMQNAFIFLISSLGESHRRTLYLRSALVEVTSLLGKQSLSVVTPASATEENTDFGNYMMVGCYDPSARVLMADGCTTKPAASVQIGDLLASPSSDGRSYSPVRVVGHTIQASREDGKLRELVSVGNMLISPMHPLQYLGKWMRPIYHPFASSARSSCELHNFVVQGFLPIVVNGIVVSTLGTYCPGHHDFQWPTHALWGSGRIVEIYAQHPTWPTVRLSADDQFLAVIKSEAFAKEFLEQSSKNISLRNLLSKYGWKHPNIQYE
mmetsp:Transcript_16827/g.23154  ORF Transcript_16827/g.23154 Transcript_16827/m.23154 type:complete len:824 (-) Transcript_16827:227-2698(-)|eukprot:CAMPEP_0170113914 /NCGR_PEP_ID=MMETSP0020_2-20130122/10296_1 /TAXON_ID=98059 /ORGANISM="Dinobryon sp., Strain UTEXLB2267" /LENGTH=823 /DNA_ID=CAMNT_0010340609 /DNA_START=33 /DNA_END=2504 /DNA_ORIENTATION=-